MVCLGHLIVYQSSLHPIAPWFKMSPDARQYLAMVEGEHADRPYSQRILVPWLASLLPMPADKALRLVTYLSLGAAYFAGILTLRRMRFSTFDCIVGMSSLFAATGHIYNYSSPHLTDAFGLMCLSFMLYFALDRRFAPFLLASVVGVLAREATLALAPLYFATKRWSGATLALTIVLTAYIVTRRIDGGPLHPAFYPPSASYFIQTYLAWGVLWIPMLAGVALCGKEFRRIVSLAFALLTAGAIFSSLTAYDTIRMWAILLPVGLVCWTCFFSELRKRAPVLMAALWVIALCNLPLAVPTILLPGSANGMTQWEDFYFRYMLPVTLLHLAGLAVNVAAVIVLRHEIARVSRTPKRPGF